MSHIKTTKLLFRFKNLGRFDEKEQRIIIAAHWGKICMGYPKEAEKLIKKFPELKEHPGNHDLLRAEIYNMMFPGRPTSEDNDEHYDHEIKKIGEVIERLNKACYKDNRKSVGRDKTLVDMERELAEHDRKASQGIGESAEETSDHIREMDLTQDEEHRIIGKKSRKGNAKKQKAKPKTKAKGKSEEKRPNGKDVKAEPPMNRPFIMIPSKMRPNRQ